MKRNEDSEPTQERSDSGSDRPEAGVRALLEAAESVAGVGEEVRFYGCEDGEIGHKRAEQVSRLGLLSRCDAIQGERLPNGGEHAVHYCTATGRITKVALDGSFGFIVDEKALLDPRSFSLQRKLRHRRALPSEYLWRWAVLAAIFGLPTRFEGVFRDDETRAALVISQPFIGYPEDGFPSWDTVEGYLSMHDFIKVDDRSIGDPVLHGAVWYRQRDGLLVSDVFPRNFRLTISGAVVPVDLVVNVVPHGGSSILPAPDVPFQLPIF